MNSVSNLNAVPAGITPAPPVKNQIDSPPDLRDTLEKLGEEKKGLEDKLSRYAAGQKTTGRAFKICRIVALAGGAVFITGAFMASMAPFVAGAALGSLAYISSGFFKGRSEWFGREVRNLGIDYQVLQKKYEKAEKEVQKAKTEVMEMARNLAGADDPEKIADDDDFVYIDGLRIEKKYRHIGDVFHDLFGELKKE